MKTLLLIFAVFTFAFVGKISASNPNGINNKNHNSKTVSVCFVIPGKYKGTDILLDTQGNPVGGIVHCKGRRNDCIVPASGGTSNYTLTIYDETVYVTTYNVGSYSSSQVTIEGDPDSTDVTFYY